MRHGSRRRPARDWSQAPSPGAVTSRTTGESGPWRVTIDSRAAERGDLFVGLRGEHHDGGEYAAQALTAGAWGVLVAHEHAERALAAALAGPGGAVLVHPDPLRGLQALANAWRRELGARGTKVVAITGSTGQDLDEGHPRGRAECSAADRGQQREPEHRDRAAAVAARGARRH